MVDAEGNALLPMAILDAEGRLLRVGLSSEKAYAKSVESGSLWGVNPGTGRVLPVDGVTELLALSRNEGSVQAKIRGHESVAETSDSQSDAPTRHSPNQLEAGERSGDVLDRLESVVAVRHSEMPEGSYTTHLFREGVEKIRKKTGEEAIELILARQRDDTVNEAADLLYHLLVLLRAEGISLGEVLSELDSRLRR